MPAGRELHSRGREEPSRTRGEPVMGLNAPQYFVSPPRPPAPTPTPKRAREPAVSSSRSERPRSAQATYASSARSRRRTPALLDRQAETEAVARLSVPIRRSSEFQQRMRELEAEERARQHAECTFQPRMNWNVRALRGQDDGQSGIRKPSRPPSSDSVYARSQAWQLERKALSEEAKQRHVESELNQCTFQPRLVSRRRNAATRQARDVKLAEPRRRSPRGAAWAYSAGEQTPPFRPQLHPPPRWRAGISPRAKVDAGQHRRTRASDTAAAELASAAERARPADAAGEYAEPAYPFAPQTTPPPPLLSDAAAAYLHTDPFDRLHHNLRPSSAPAVRARGERGVRRGARAEGEEDEEGQRGRGGGPRSARLSERSVAFRAFLERQNETLRRRDQIAEQLREQEVAERRRAAQLPQRSRPGSGARAHAHASFLARLEQSVSAYHDKQAVALRQQSEAPPLDPEAERECTFRPQLHASARAHRRRSPDELAYGDVVRKELMRMELAERELEAEDAELTRRPMISRLPYIDGALQISTDKDGFLERMKEREQRKEELIAAVREAQTRKELAQCSFKPKVRQAPRYVQERAQAVANARARREARISDFEHNPGWRYASGA